jgi:hypothetical protein
MLAIILVPGSRATRPAGCVGSAKRSAGGSLFFQVAGQASGHLILLRQEFVDREAVDGLLQLTKSR